MELWIFQGLSVYTLYPHQQVTSPYKKDKIYYLILSFFFFLLCIIIVIFSHELGTMRGSIGDVVIVMFLYSFVRIFSCTSQLSTIFMILILAYSVESLQYFDILSPLGLENSALARLVLGAVYDPLDIFAYTLGGILIYFFDRFFTSRYIQN